MIKKKSQILLENIMISIFENNSNKYLYLTEINKLKSLRFKIY